MLWGGIAASFFLTTLIVFWLAVLGGPKNQENTPLVICIFSFFLFLISAGITIFGFIDYLRN
jgi:hypothetical protein